MTADKTSSIILAGKCTKLSCNSFGIHTLSSRSGGFLMQVRSATSRTRQVAAATIGNALEWYDFMIFGYLTAIVSRLFFPTTDAYCSLLATTATFGVGFCMRPVGGILIGIYADKRGRKAAMQLIVALMTASMALMACCPTYAQAGIISPLIIVLARLLQGFATGGEFSCATAFLIECAPPGRRGFYGSWQMFGQSLSMIAGTAIGAFLTGNLAASAIDAWGWRIPFALGMLIAPVGLWIRKYVEEPDEFVRAQRTTPPAPLKHVLKYHRRALLSCLALTSSGTISVYILNVYMPTFVSHTLHLPLHQAFSASMIAGLSVMGLVPLFGMLSDRIGRKPVLIGGLIVLFFLYYPMFSLAISQRTFMAVLFALTILGAVRAVGSGVASTVLAEQFPVAVRSTGLSASYNIAVMAFGGTAQFVVTWLIHVTGTPMSMVFYLMVANVVGLVACLFLREPQSTPIPQPEPVRQKELVGATRR
jgi:MFS family permease